MIKNILLLRKEITDERDKVNRDFFAGYRSDLWEYSLFQRGASHKEASGDPHRWSVAV